jgi:8-oxo-dGTP pyrophosphatase MutT (NUDIX family)
VSSRTIARYRVISLREDHYRFEPTGIDAPFVVCESGDWVLVLAITPDGQLVLARQFRHGVREAVLEVPGGIVDPGESPVAAGLRELAEETGYTAQRAEYLGRLLPNPALNTAHLHVVLAEGCRPAGTRHLEPLERIDVTLRPLDDIPAMIRSGELRHALVIAAWTMMKLREG